MIIKQLNIKDIQRETQPLSVCLGYFDGLHLGHQRLVQQAIQVAEKEGYRSGLITFKQDPLTVLNPSINKQQLTTNEDRQQLGQALGLDYWYELDFNKEVSQTSPEEFIEKMIIDFGVKHVVVGFDYRFGFKGAGTPEVLKELSAGRYTVDVIEPVQYLNEKISSTRIINLIEKGMVEDLPKLLGRYYHLQGKVGHGRRHGHKLGYPTANLLINPSYVIPKNGVYIGAVEVDKQWYPAMISVGHNPTVDRNLPLTIEAHLLDQKMDLYDRDVKIDFRKYQREQIAFESMDLLKHKMAQDYQETKEYFSKNPI